MPSPEGSQRTRHSLLAAGNSQFLSGIPNLVLVPEEIATVQHLFEAMGFEIQPQAIDLDSTSMLNRCMGLRRSAERGDVQVVYYTSHGHRDRERFYILTSNTIPDELDTTAIAAEDLARNLIKDSKAKQVLIIFDLCNAGGHMADVASLASQLVRTACDDPELVIIAAASTKQDAEEMIFVRALTEVFDMVNQGDERLAGKVQPYIQIGSLMREINSRLSFQTARYSTVNLAGECLAFPNPNFIPQISPGLDLETQGAYIQILRRSFQEHWIPKARSVDSGGGGWYFTGRERALTEIVTWLKQPNSGGLARVVTGSAGSGKSALLSRLVTLSDPRWRKDVVDSCKLFVQPTTLPPVGVVNAAVVLRNKLLVNVVAELASQLSIAVADAAELRESILTSPSSTVIIFDALDEADERKLIVDEILRPLALLPQVFLIVGSRPDPISITDSSCLRRVRAFGTASCELDLDDPVYCEPTDLEIYVERRLLASEETNRVTPYQKIPQVAKQVSQALAVRASHSFLVARTAVAALLNQAEAVDVSLEDWQENLPNGFEEALEQFLGQLDIQGSAIFHEPDAGDPFVDGAIARAVLLPLAFAEGEGLPWEQIWAPLATMLFGMPISDEQIRSVRYKAAPFIVEALEEGRSVYRLFHERAAEYLRSTKDELEAQRLIVSALLESLPHLQGQDLRDWTQAHSYIRSHLATHARRAGLLDELTADQLFLAASDPSRLLTVFNSITRDGSFGSESLESDARTDKLKAITATYALAYDTLTSYNFQERLSYLGLAARQLGYRRLADEWEASGFERTWTVIWAHWLTVSPHRKITNKASSLSLTSLNGRPVIIAGSLGRGIQIIDLSTGEPIEYGMTGNSGDAAVVYAASIAGQSAVISGGEDGAIKIWRFDNATIDDESIDPCVLHGHYSAITAISVVTLVGGSIVAASSEDASICAWNLQSIDSGGEDPSFFMLNGHIGPVLSIAFACRNGKPVIVSGGEDMTVRVWDLESGEAIGAPLEGHNDSVIAVAVTSIQGLDAIASVGRDGFLIKWDIVSLQSIGAPLQVHDGEIDAIATGIIGESEVVLASGLELTANGYAATIKVLDLRLGSSIVPPLLGHGNPATALAVASIDSEQFVVSSNAYDETLRVWNLSDQVGIGAGSLAGHGGEVNSVSLASYFGQSIVVSGSIHTLVRLWDLASGELITTFPDDSFGYLDVLTTAALCDGSIVVAAGDGGEIVVWDLAKQNVHSHSWVGVRLPAIALAVINADSHPQIVTSSLDCALRIWDYSSGEIVKTVPLYSIGPSRAFSTATLGGEELLVSAHDDLSLRLWASSSGDAWGTPLFGHVSPVVALATASLNGRPVVVSGGFDKKLRIWDIATSMLIAARPGHADCIRAIDIAAHNGESIVVTGSQDGAVRLWALNRGAALLVPLLQINIGTPVNSIAFAEGCLVVGGGSGLLAIRIGDI